MALEGGATGSTVQTAPMAPLALVTKKLCFKHTVTFLDSAGGEDTWANTTPYQTASTGARVNIGTTGSFYLGSAIGTNHGCVTGTWTVGSQLVTLFSQGIVSGHSITVLDPNGVLGSRNATVNITSSTSTQTFTIDTLGTTYEDELNIYMATARTLQQVPGLETGALLVRHQGTSSSHSSGLVTIASGTNEGPGDTGDAKEKFTIAHEVGHFISADSTDRPSSNFSYTGQDSQCTSSSTSHSLKSIEWQSGAFNEGFASFVAGRAFNAPGQSDCWIVLQEGSVVNCEGDNPNPDIPVRHMERNCEDDQGADDWEGLGNETDWHRTFWDMHSPNGNPSVNQMLTWMKDANNSTAWAKDNVYSLLDAEANDIGGTLNNRWNSASAGGTGTDNNGIDHPLIP